MFRDALKFLMHGHEKDFSPVLDPRLDTNVEPQCPEDVAQIDSNTKNTTTKENTQQPRKDAPNQ